MKKKALITGASDGIGKAFAKRLAKEGFQIIGVARNEEKLKNVILSLDGTGHSYITADLSDPSDIKEIELLIQKESFDLLINNAGHGLLGEFDKTPLDRIQSMVRLNCDALLALSHAFLSTSKSGDAIINISSAIAFLPSPSSAVYAATKAFVLFLSEALWFEQKNRGVYVLALCPGVTTSNFHITSGGGDHNKPLDAISQQPDEVVDLAIKALRDRKEPTIVSGIQNELTVCTTKLMPRKALINMAGNFLSIKK
ncbi:MAG: SDR family oxidoreductase [Leptospiraceae bacterium]|nr:SDR family oxidoreductase [Leptospiraceae bacterium]